MNAKPDLLVGHLTREENKMSKSKSSIHKPGEKAPESGQYGIVGPKGGKTGTEVTVTKGKTLPPTQKPGQGFTLDDKTKHKGDK